MNPFRWLRFFLRGERDPMDVAGPSMAGSVDHPGLSAPQLRFLQTKIYFHRCLTEAQRTTLEGLVARFLREKRFWGSQDLQVLPEMKLIVAAWACLPIIELPHLWVYPHTREVILYPGHFGETVEAFGPGAEIAARIADRVLYELDGPIARFGAQPSPVPYSPVLEAEMLPTHASIAARVREVAAA